MARFASNSEITAPVSPAAPFRTEHVATDCGANLFRIARQIRPARSISAADAEPASLPRRR